MPEVLSQDDIDRMLYAINAQDETAIEPRPSPEEPKIKFHDFLCPDLFSEDEFRTLQILHQDFAKLAAYRLSSFSGFPAYLHVMSADIDIFEEVLRSAPLPTVLAPLALEPLRSRAVLLIGPPVCEAVLDGALGGTTRLEPEADTDYYHGPVELAILRKVLAGLATDLCAAWAPRLSLRPVLGPVQTDPSRPAFIRPSGSVALVTMETRIGDIGGYIQICYPNSMLIPVRNRLDPLDRSKPDPESPQPRIDTERLARREFDRYAVFGEAAFGLPGAGPTARDLVDRGKEGIPLDGSSSGRYDYHPVIRDRN